MFGRVKQVKHKEQIPEPTFAEGVKIDNKSLFSRKDLGLLNRLCFRGEKKNEQIKCKQIICELLLGSVLQFPFLPSKIGADRHQNVMSLWTEDVLDSTSMESLPETST